MLARRIVRLWPLIALMALALTGAASAHASLVSSNPKDGASLAAAPAKITLIFSEELQPDGNQITVTDAGGAQVDNSDTTLDLNDPNRVTLTVTLKGGLGAGAYTVGWKNLSADGHSEEGSLSFSVVAAAATTTAAPTSVPATGASGPAPLAAILLGALLLAGAGLGLRRWVR
ncbi:copper resistance protein CopC [Oscillochloris sp. ZM17-4]|uniref:copper resistance CopC family protein n=1 Tax=Oscillochloris sp. ZM17-4 TaxID=2866714 RepID=UPI001C731864|nr:copper resistance protein CopC [Oscillochloris sp. ZM17-4]MBX0329574.1 copper resistance protein CopC [Oscillochloris sp. ZM17-4]